MRYTRGMEDDEEFWFMILEGSGLSDTFISDARGCFATCLAIYPDPDDEVCPGHVEFLKWVAWSLSQPPDPREYRN